MDDLVYLQDNCSFIATTANGKVYERKAGFLLDQIDEQFVEIKILFFGIPLITYNIIAGYKPFFYFVVSGILGELPNSRILNYGQKNSDNIILNMLDLTNLYKVGEYGNCYC